MDDQQIPQRVWKPYIGSSLTYSAPYRVPTWMISGSVTDIRDGEHRVIRVGGANGNLEVDRGDWIDSEVDAKRKMALMLCDYIDGIRGQVDELLDEVRALESGRTDATTKKGAA